MSRSIDLSSEGAPLAPSPTRSEDTSSTNPGSEEVEARAELARSLLDEELDPENSDDHEEDDGTAIEGAGDDDELSLAEASELVGVSTRALRDRVQRGSLAARKVTREGRVLSVVRRADLLEIYGWMVAEGERKRMVEDSGGRRKAPAEPKGAAGLPDPLGDAARQLRVEVDKLQRALVDVTAEMRLVREAHVRQREQDIRARADHEREITLLQERAAALANEMRLQRGPDTRPMMGRTPWEIVAVSLLLTVVVFALWVRFQSAEARRADDLLDLKQQVTEVLEEARSGAYR